MSQGFFFLKCLPRSDHFVLRTPNMTILLLVLHFWYLFRVVTSCSFENHSFSYGCAPPQNEDLNVFIFFFKMINIIIFGCTSSRRFTLLIQFFTQLKGKFYHCLLLPHERAFQSAHEPDFWSDSIFHMGVSYLPTAVNSLSTRMSFYHRLKHSDFWSDYISALD